MVATKHRFLNVLISVKEDEKIILILAGDQTVVSKPADMLVEPKTIYKSNYHIRGLDPFSYDSN